METERENVNNKGVIDVFVDCDSTEYFSHTLTEFVDGENRNDWILVTRSSIGK